MKVGIVYSVGFGAGWSTWGNPQQALDQELANAVERKADLSELIEIAQRNWPAAYLGGISNDLRVEWVESGTQFQIDEYDGSESVLLKENHEWHVAEPAQLKGAES